MKAISLLILVVLLAAVHSKSPKFDENSTIIKLTSHNFDEVTQGFKDSSWVLLFYAPWCPHCKDIQEVYENLYKNLKDKFIFAEIDSEKNIQIKDRFGVTQFPTILLVDHETQQYHRFRGTRAEVAIEEFLTKTYKDFPGNDLPDRPSLFKTLKSYYSQVGTPIVIGGIILASLLLIITLVDLARGEKKEKVNIDDILKEAEEANPEKTQKQKSQKKQTEDKSSKDTKDSKEQDKKKKKEKKDQ